MSRGRYTRLLCSAAAIALVSAGAAHAEDTKFDIQPQSLSTALNAFSEQASLPVLFKTDMARQKQSPGVSGSADPEIALAQLLQGTGLGYRRAGDSFVIVPEGGDPQSGSAAGGGAEVEALIVTAQKREEDIQDVPIAISAFTQEDLTRSQVAGGPDLMTQVPNMTFTKTNFSSYSIQLRGIGTQAISATTDAAVAVAFNNTPFIRNHFFEQEFYDLQRVEVLRGPQGTLYGRNATAGVVNVISAKPIFRYEAKLSGDVSNYSSTRLEGMLNIPLVEDKVAVRMAAAWTKRNGYVTNEITGNPIDGRDLWSTRLSLRFSPNDRIDANLIWEHFTEDDDRLRSGKQLCKTDFVNQIGPYEVNNSVGWQNPSNETAGGFSSPSASFSQGCEPSSMYSPDSFETPNGRSLPYYLPLGAIFLPTALDDPYVSRLQSHDLRVIESTVDPEYRARNDLGELQVTIDLTDNLTLSSETAYSADMLFSQQDYNRFNTAPGAWEAQPELVERGILLDGPNGAVFCDPQIGCTDRMVAVDISQAKSHQFSQEFRLSSNFSTPFNFSLGANYLRYDNEDKYYVFINSLSLIAAISPFSTADDFPYVGGVTDNGHCLTLGRVHPDPAVIQPIAQCTYIDPNPIGALNDEGHNYFLSKNPYKLISYAVFGETYYQVTENLKVTAGLRWTVDKKQAPRIPSWLLASDSIGYPVTEVVNQEWREPTGRLAIDWKPELSFTDETLLYASYAHGYKAGGANPPPTGPVKYCIGCGRDSGQLETGVVAKSATHPKTFEPEFIDAFELGSKNTLLDGRLTVNLAAFYYDYTGYQISQIVNRSAVNLNFDAKIWGLEIEADWRPVENLRLGFKGGFEDTRVADGMQAVDLMDRTAGHEDWVLVRPFPTFPSNCILPLSIFVGVDGLYRVGNVGGGVISPCELAYVLGYDPVTEAPYDPDLTLPDPRRPFYHGFDPATAPNNGEGFYKDLSGNQLPNAPTFTATITADYTVPLPSDWLMTLHTDLYYQSEAWTRIFNMEGYDKLKAYTNINLAAIFTNEEAGWKVMAYIKNVLDRDSITGAFLNSDDTGLTTNVFLTEPRLFGLRVTKEWNGGPWWTGASANHVGPYPLTVEIGGMAQRHDAPYALVGPSSSVGFADALSPARVQNQDLDWGDSRELKLTYAPANSPWRISAGYRYGETNKANRLRGREDAGRSCLLSQAACEYYFPLYGENLYFKGPNYAAADGYDREEHTLVDFTVGRDVGLGLPLSRSTFRAGLQYAEFTSTTQFTAYGIPDWQFPDEFVLLNPLQRHQITTDLHAEREFEGVGPALAWDAAIPLLGDDQAGRLELDWSIGAGLLFGKQSTTFTGEESSQYYNGMKYFGGGFEAPDEPPVITPAPAARSNSVTVPLVDLSLGLSYEIRRVKVGAGYRWERYFDVLDGGYAEERSYDRTIDGPYFKLSVGFGG